MIEEVAVRMVEPRAPRPTRSDDAYFQRQAAEKARLDSWNAKAKDKIGALLGSLFVRHNEVWPNIRTASRESLTCSRFYPAINVAVDIFPVIGPEQERAIAWKREVFKAMGTRYGALSYDMEVTDLVPQVGLA